MSTATTTTFASLTRLTVINLPPLMPEEDAEQAEAEEKKGARPMWKMSETVFTEQLDVQLPLINKRVVVFVIDPSQNPLLVPDFHRPPLLHKLYNTPVTVYRMALHRRQRSKHRRGREARAVDKRPPRRSSAAVDSGGGACSTVGAGRWYSTLLRLHEGHREHGAAMN